MAPSFMTKTTPHEVGMSSGLPRTATMSAIFFDSSVPRRSSTFNRRAALARHQIACRDARDPAVLDDDRHLLPRVVTFAIDQAAGKG